MSLPHNHLIGEFKDMMMMVRCSLTHSHRGIKIEGDTQTYPYFENKLKPKWLIPRPGYMYHGPPYCVWNKIEVLHSQTCK